MPEPTEEIEKKENESVAAPSWRNALDDALKNMDDKQGMNTPLVDPEQQQPVATTEEPAAPTEQPKKEEQPASTTPEPEQKPKEEKQATDDGPVLPSLDDEEEESPTPVKEEDKNKKPETKPESQVHEDEDDPRDPPRVKKRLENARRRGEEEAETRLKAEYDRKVAELEAKLQQKQSEQPAGETLAETEKDELLQLRRLVAAQSDPEIKKNYDDRIANNRQAILETLKQNFPSSEDQEKIAKLGNFDEWATDPRNGQAYKKLIEALAAENPADADIIRAQISENRSLSIGKQRALQEMSKGAKEWFDKQQQETQAQQAQIQEQQQKSQQYVTSQFEKALETSKSLQLKPTTGLEGDALKRVKAENAVIEQQRKFLQDVKDRRYSKIEDGVNIVLTAAKAIKLNADLKATKARLAEVEAELKARQDAGKVSRGNRATAATTRAEEQERPRNWNEGLEQALARAATQD